ncbi:MAG: arginine--tRNA ligase [Chlamydiota bacterium]
MSPLSRLFKEKISEALRQIGIEDSEDLIEIAPCLREELGHHQTNIAFRIAKSLGKAPLELARALEEKLCLQNIAQSVQVTPPGFINVTWDQSFLAENLQALLADPMLGISPPKKERIVVEFSSPNIAKELHVGHLRSTIIGESLARLLEFQGHDVLRLNHIGDWGTQFGMLIAYIFSYKEQEWNSASLTLERLMEWYREAKRCFDEDEEFRKKGQKAVVALQGGDPAYRAVWEQICAISRTAFEEIYSLLGVEIQERGESFYQPEMPAMVEELERRGVVELSGGAKCIFVPGFTNREGEPMPFMVQKSDGGYTYDTTDLAALRQRVEVEKADRIIVVTDSGQALHFQLLFGAAVKAGYYSREKVRMDHVTFGLVLGENRKKFKTRSGDTEKLVDLLNQAVEKAHLLVREKSPNLPEKEQAFLARVLGISSVKYADLASQRQKDYVFSYARMLRFEGNTAIFLLYSYVRMLGIQRNISTDPKTLLRSNMPHVEHPSEVALCLHLLRFADIIAFISSNLEPHHLCEYLYQLAEKFNAFFRDCRVKGASEQNGRLCLVEAARQVLEKGLCILGIPIIERM